MHLNGENGRNVILTGKTLWKWANGLNIYDSEKRTPGAGLPPPGAIYMYITIIFKDLFL